MRRGPLSAVIVVCSAASLSAQVLSQRGFAEGRGEFYAQPAPNDPVQSTGDFLTREELFVKPLAWLQFAAGMDLQGTIARSRSPEVVERLSRTVDDFQATIDDIRNTIFKLQAHNDAASTFRGRVERVVADLTNNQNIAGELRRTGVG